MGESDRRHWETSGRHDPASGIQTQGDKWETRIRSQRLSIWHPTTGTSGRQDPGASSDPEPGRHRKRSGRHDPEPASQHLTAETEKQRQNKRETQPRSQRHSIWPLTAETGRHRETSGRRDPAASVTALASDRRDWETQGDKRETRPWHLTAETGRHSETSGAS